MSSGMVDRTWLLVHITIAKALVASHPYDHRGIFVLLDDLDGHIAPSLSGVLGSAMHANTVAALTHDEQASERAREALADVIAFLEQRCAALRPPS